MNKIGNYLNVRLMTIGKYKFTILFVVMLLVFSYILGGGRFGDILIQCLAVVSFVFLLNTFAKIRLSIPLTILVAFLLTINAYSAFIFKAPFTPGVLASVMETNLGEIKSMGKSMLPLGLILFLVILLLMLLAQKELRDCAVSAFKSLIIFVLFWICLLTILILIVSTSEKWEERYVGAKYFSIHLYLKPRTPLIISDIFAVRSYFEENEKVKEYKTSERTIPEGVFFNDSVQSVSKIYLIIGESASRNNMSLYGYPVKTTPFFDALSEDKTVKFNYYNAIPSAILTRDAVRTALTFCTPTDNKPFMEHKNLLEMARAASYDVTWISSQSQIGVFETPVGMISSSANQSYFRTASLGDDLDLLPTVSNSLNDKKQLIVLHLDGSHSTYTDRYDDEDRSAIQTSGVVADYNRTLHHTDRVLKGLYEIAEKEGGDFILLYFSDHGEVVGVGHGLFEMGPEQLDIPLVTINHSNIFVDSIVSSYIDRNTNLINNSSVMNIICSLMGYSFSEAFKREVVQGGKYIHQSEDSGVLYEDIMKTNNTLNK